MGEGLEQSITLMWTDLATFVRGTVLVTCGLDSRDAVVAPKLLQVHVYNGLSRAIGCSHVQPAAFYDMQRTRVW